MNDDNENNARVEDLLLTDKIITSEQLSAAKLEHINTGQATGEILLNRGLITKLQLLQARAKLAGIPFVEVSTTVTSPEVLVKIPEQVAQKYKLLPFAFDKGKNVLSVVMADPLDLQVVEFIEKKSQCKILPYYGVPEDITAAIAERYGQGLTSEVSAALKEAPEETENPQELTEEKVDAVIREAPVAKIVNTILEFAIKSRASDIHIEPMEDKTRVRYRIDGILNEKLILPKKVHDSLVSRVKILSELKIDEKRLPQDGRFNFKAGNEEVDLRVSTLPTVHGEKIVMRLLKKSGGVPTLQELGLRGTALKNLEIAMLRPHGIIIVCGPTGSGKTTTLYSVLTRINSSKINIVTLEDPVEYQMTGVNQVQINPMAGLTFASGLRSFLRQDPNVVLVGEIRDDETADLAIQAALTGHLVFSTLHTNNAAGTLPRLLDMKAEPFLLASSMNAVVGQRICRKVCPVCRETYEPPETIVADVKNVLGKLLDESKFKDGKLLLYRGKGCDQCGNIGYVGRVGIFEVLPISEKLGKMILERASADEIEKQAVSEGMISMKQDGYMKAVEGITTLEEVLRVAQD